MVARSTMIDWDLAVTAASRMAGPGAGHLPRARPRTRVAELRAGAERPRRWSASSPGCEADGPDGPGPRRRPARLGAGQRRRLRRGVRPAGRADPGAQGGALAGWPRQSGHGSPGSRSAPCSASCPRRCSASSTRSTASQPRRRRRDVGHRAGRPAAAGGPEHRARRARDGRRPARLPALGLPARGDPPGPVHRRAVDARPHPRPDREHSSARSRSTRRKLAAMVGEGVRRIGDILRGDDDVSLLDLFSSARQREVLDRITAVMSLLEGHADVVMDGVGPDVIPTVAEIRRRFNERRKGSQLPRPRAAPAARARRQDGAVPRRRSLRARRPRPGRHGGAQRRVGRARQPPDPRGDRRPATPGSGACTAEHDARPGRRSRPAGRATRPRRDPGSGRARGPGGVLRRGRLARAPRRHRLRGPPAGAARRRRDRRPRPAGGLGCPRGPRRRADGGPRGGRDGRRPGPGGSRRARAGGGGPRGPVRRPRGGRPAQRRGRWCCSATPATTRRRPCCSG